MPDSIKTTSFPFIYLVYFKCHDIDWNVDERIAYRDVDGDLELVIGRGEFRIPEMARPPKVKHRSGGASIGLGPAGTVGTLDPDAIHIGVGIYVTEISPLELQKTADRAEVIAATCGVALGQALGLEKVAEYSRNVVTGDENVRLAFRYSARVPGPAKFDSQVRDDLAQALTNIDNSTSNSLPVAISWYETSKSMVRSMDRYVALWIAVEALAGSKIEQKRSWFSKVQDASCSSVNNVEHTHGDPDVEFLNLLRNKLVHRGELDVNPQWDGTGLLVSREQFVDSFVAEGIRMAVGLAATDTAHEQLRISYENSLAHEHLLIP